MSLLAAPRHDLEIDHDEPSVRGAARGADGSGGRARVDRSGAPPANGMASPPTGAGEASGGAEGDAAEGEEDETKGKKSRLLGRLLKRRGQEGEAADDAEHLKRPEDRTRYWELNIALLRMKQIINPKPVNVFFAFSMGHMEPKKYASQVKLAPQYSPMYTLGKEDVILKTPQNLYVRKFFTLSYKELDRHVVKMDMWEVSSWTFNTYAGVGCRSLGKVAREATEREHLLKKKLTRAQELENRKHRRQARDAAKIRVQIGLEEVFNCKLSADNFTLKMDEDRHHPEKTKPYRLRFIMPKIRTAMPGKSMINCKVSKLYEGTKVGNGNFYENCGEYIFQGTITNLQNSYFVVRVYEPNFLLKATNNTAAEKIVEKGPTFAFPLGDCLMNLTSVLDIPVFIAKVKKFGGKKSKDPDADILEVKDEYEVGDISGYVKVELASAKLKTPEVNLSMERPMQLTSSTNVAQLNENERYLVINVDKAQGLPIADIDDGSSDPYVRVTWDNITKQSPVMAENLNPVFKYRAYFPVRFGVQLMQKNAKIEKKYQRVYECELNSDIKGVKLEVFDSDDTSAEMLGMTSVPMWKVLKANQQKRSMLGKAKGGDDDEAELLVQNDGQEEAPSSNSQWYDQEVLTRVYDGKKTPLRNSALKNDKAAFIFFEAYFYPDWDESIDLDEPPGGGDAGDPWKSFKDEWDAARRVWKDSYHKNFPDAIGSLPHVSDGNDKADVRIFTCVADHPLKTPAMTPLMSFLCPIIIPEDEGFPARLMHLINCLTFESQADHLRTGRISRSSWHDSDHVLAKRKGTVWDHAVLLCSLLLGCKKDAYICKGLIKRGDTGDSKRQMSEYIEHVWVMTRETESGWVTFWEPCTHQRFHLPYRCKKKEKAGKAHKKDKKGHKSRSDSNANDEARQSHPKEMELFQTSQVADEEVLVAQEKLPMVGRKPWPKVKSGKNKAPVGGSGREGGTESTNEVLLLPMAPDLEMLKFKYAPESKSKEGAFADSTLVTWLPYSSIDVVFNDKNLWANQQNHHPGCITYDMDEQRHGPRAKWRPKWVPLKESEKDEATKFEPITPQVKLLPPLKGSQAQGLEDDLLSELRQTIALYRQTRGNDTAWDQKEELVEKIRKYLDIWELWMQLDVDNPELQKFFQDDIDQYTRDLAKADEDHDEAHDKKSKQSKDDAQSKRSAKISSGGAGAGEQRKSDDEEAKDRVNRFIRENFKEDFMERYCNIYGSPDFVGEQEGPYRIDQKARIDTLKSQVGEFLEQKTWPVKRGLKFDGFPVHFSDPDKEQVRQYLMNMKKFLDAVEDEADDVVHTVVCKLFPLPGRVLSVWVYIGWQKGVDDDDDEDEDDENEEGEDEGGEE